MDADEIRKRMKPSQPKAVQLIGRVQFVSVGPGTPDDRLIIKTMVEVNIASGLNDAMAKAIELGYEPPEVLQ